MSNGLKTKAPCGHDGESVIGAYVRCLQGCARDPYVQGSPPSKARRGEVGHVDFCACKPCTFRRRATKIVLRTKGGKTYEIPWDGYSNQVDWKSEHTDRVRHWKVVDADGDALVEGMCDVEMSPGDPMHIQIAAMFPAKLVVGHAARTSLRHHAKPSAMVDHGLGALPPGTVLAPYTEEEIKSYAADPRVWKLSPEQADHWRKVYAAFPERPTKEGFRSVALGVPGVVACDIAAREYETIVWITETDAQDEAQERQIAEDVRVAAQQIAPAGCRVTVVRGTPMKILALEVEALRRALEARGSTSQIWRATEKRLFESLKRFEDVIVSTFRSMNNGEVSVTYKSSTGSRKHIQRFALTG